MNDERITLTVNINLAPDMARKITDRFNSDAKSVGVPAFRFEDGKLDLNTESKMDLYLFLDWKAIQSEKGIANMESQMKKLLDKLDQNTEISSIEKFGVVFCNENKFGPIGDLGFFERCLKAASDKIPQDPDVDLVALRYFMDKSNVFEARLEEIEVLSVASPAYYEEMMGDMVEILDEVDHEIDVEAALKMVEHTVGALS